MENLKFKLQKLLDIRAKAEEESKIKLTEAQNKKLKVEKNLAMLQENYHKYSSVRSFEDIITQKITVNYLSSLNQSIDFTNKELEVEKEKVNKAKEDLIEKQIKRKTLETLKEKSAERIKKEIERKEQNEADEFALYAYMRNKENVS